MRDPGRRRRLVVAVVRSAGVAAAGAPAAVLEIGVDDQRVSFLGLPGDVSSGAGEVAVALDPGRGRYLVIWSGYESLPDPGTEGTVETRGLYAQRLDAATGEPIGERTQISTRLAFSPPVLLFDPAGDRWDVFFDAPFAGGVDILHLRLDGATAAPLGPAVAVQPAGANGLYPDAELSPERGEILVAWDAEGEIVVQRLDAGTGEPLPPHGAAISSIGPPGDDAYAAFLPRVAWNAVDAEYLVAFLATPEEGPGVISDHFEVHGQRLDGAAAEIGADDFRISAMGAPDDSGSSAGHLDVAFDDLAGDYLVVWEGNRTTPDVGPFEVEIYSQRLDGGSGAEIGTDDLRVTAVGGLGDPGENARRPRLVFDRERRQFLLSELADTPVGDQGDTELRVHEIDAASGISRSLEGDALSQSGGPDDPSSRVLIGTIAAFPAADEMIAVWSGEDDEGGMGPDETEVFAQRARPGSLFADGFESGDLSAWNAIEPRPWRGVHPLHSNRETIEEGGGLRPHVHRLRSGSEPSICRGRRGGGAARERAVRAGGGLARSGSRARSSGHARRERRAGVAASRGSARCGRRGAAGPSRLAPRREGRSGSRRGDRSRARAPVGAPRRPVEDARAPPVAE